jgi:hypothetical protein
LSPTAIVTAFMEPASADITTVSGDNTRQSWKSDEAALPPSLLPSINQTFSTAVSGAVLAQPLVVGSTVIVATENDWV